MFFFIDNSRLLVQASAYVAQVYDAVLAYAHALTRLHEAGTIDKVREPSLDIVHHDRLKYDKVQLRRETDVITRCVCEMMV